MADIKYPYQDSEGSYAQRQEDEKNWGEFGELAQETFKNWLKYTEGTSGREAENWQDGGRGCIRCAGSLMIFEESENGYIMLECRDCGMHQWHTDIEPDSKEKLAQWDKEAKAAGAAGARHLSDEIYRKIPDSLVLQYSQMREKKLQGS
ncbi:hypothetical protein ACFX4N_24385 [Priestia sp. YIM B13551]|uniref:hypothetical protein n=1 Tax=Priestia sp. YIM B13551 TaxID=3366306 RepID=UPI00366C5652